MNRMMLLAVSLCVASSVQALEPKLVVDGDVTEAQVSGMTILVKNVKGAELVTTELVVRGGARNWTAKNAGIEQLAFEVAATGGTTTLDRNAFARKLAGIGGTLSTSTGRAATTMVAKGPRAAFDDLFSLLTASFLNPAMKKDDIEVAREQQLAGITAQMDDPDARLQNLVRDVVWKKHPYANPAEGTVDSVKKLTTSQLTAHLQKLRETSRLLWVVVGDIDAAHVVDVVAKATAEMRAGSFVAKPVTAPVFKAATLFAEKRALPTNYIQAMGNAPKPGTASYAAAQAMNGHLWEKMFEEVRTKRNLSYAPGLRFDVSEAGAMQGIYVTAVDPATTLPVMFDVLKQAQTTPLTPDELAAAKAKARTGMLTSQQTTDAQAAALVSGVLFAGDWRMQRKLVDDIAKLTSADLQAYAKDYFGRMQMVVLGDPSKVTKALASSM
jgi:zinc protease